MKGNDRYRSDGVLASCRCCGKQYEVLNLGLGGMFVASDARPHIGEPVAFDLYLPGEDAFRMVGFVAWNNEKDRSLAPELPQGFGVRAREVDLGGKLALIRHLRRLEAKRIKRA
jgi:hypothetical protein